MRRRILSLLLPLLAVGCGGSDGGSDCVSVLTPVPNSDYAGAYTATYAPNGGAAGGSLTFTLDVTIEGAISGTVRNPSANPATADAAVTGTVGNGGCKGTETNVSLSYTLPSGSPETLVVESKKGDDLADTFKGTRRANDSQISSGKLTVEFRPIQ